MQKGLLFLSPTCSEKSERYLGCNTPSSQELGVSTSCRDSQPRGTRMRRGARMAPGGENQGGFSLPGRKGSLLETQIPPSRDEHLYCYSTSLEECTA